MWRKNNKNIRFTNSLQMINADLRKQTHNLLNDPAHQSSSNDRQYFQQSLSSTSLDILADPVTEPFRFQCVQKLRLFPF